MVRVSEQTRAPAAAIATACGSSIGKVVNEALETVEFWRQTRDSLVRHPQTLQEEPAAGAP